MWGQEQFKEQDNLKKNICSKIGGVIRASGEFAWKIAMETLAC